jgi:KipI family sensor histidine kinase inhibitor
VIRRFGEAALLVDLESAAQAQALAASLRHDPPAGMIEAVPGLESLLVELDPLAGDSEAVAGLIERRLRSLPERPPNGRLHTIRVAYGGPDLEDVARLTGLAPSEVIARHAADELRVLFCGFAPGFAYLGELAPELRVPRLATPRTRTPPGSVALAGSMSAIYPADLPGGWRVIGRAEVVLFDPHGDRPALLEPGDRVRFEPA